MSASLIRRGLELLSDDIKGKFDHHFSLKFKLQHLATLALDIEGHLWFLGVVVSTLLYGHNRVASHIPTDFEA